LRQNAPSGVTTDTKHFLIFKSTENQNAVTFVPSSLVTWSAQLPTMFLEILKLKIGKMSQISFPGFFIAQFPNFSFSRRLVFYQEIETYAHLWTNSAP
jgi:hypothetical protein